MIKSKTLEMNGIYRKDFIEYFLKIGGKTEDQKTFKGCNWEALVGPESKKILGSFKIHQVLITLNVEEDKFDEFLAKFYKNFLRAGG
ncbi:MAG: hypothetical protein H6Q64_1639 [Firmicutes bacterium]|nr:hypothetical protein [Bacillota bacterium]